MNGKVPRYIWRDIQEVVTQSRLKKDCFVYEKNAALVCQSCTLTGNL